MLRIKCDWKHYKLIGHVGEKTALVKLAYYFWPGMTKYIKKLLQIKPYEHHNIQNCTIKKNCRIWL